MDENRITYFAETDARNRRVKFGIKAKDRTRHVYTIGKTGMGKSTMLENMAVQDIQNGEGIAFIDPHGKTANLLLEYVPKERIQDVIYLAPFDVEHPISFNVLENVDPDKRHLVVSGLMSTFKKIWVDAWSARMEYILTNTLLSLLEVPDTTLLGVNRMLSDKEYRKEIVNQIKDPSVKNFWVKEFANYTERMAADAVPAIQNKIGQFTANPLIRNMLGQPKSTFNIREAMDRRKIMIINLSKGRIGDENMKLLGGMIVTKIYLAAMSRADTPDRVAQMLPNFYLYVDEFQNFANATFADILSEARKYKLNLTIAHQYIEQMDDQVRAAVFGNVGTMIAFRVGATDAEALEKEFTPQFTIEDLVNLGFTQIYLKLMIDGLTSSPFSAVTLPPIQHPDISFVKEIIEASREQFAQPRSVVEAEIIKFHSSGEKKPEVRPMPKGDAPMGASGQANKINPAPLIPSTPSPSAPSQPRVPFKTAPANTLPTFTAPNKPLSSPSVSLTPNTNIPVNKPFAKPLKEMLDKLQNANIVPKVPVVPEIRPSQEIVKKADAPKPAPAPIQIPNTPAPQPVSLKSLSREPNGPRNNPKVKSAENVNELRSALASILKKNETVGHKVESEKQKIENGGQKMENREQKVENRGERIETGEQKEAEPNLGSKIPPQYTKEAPKEVPEEVLKKVLKDGE